MTLWFRFNFKRAFLIILFGFIFICGVVLCGIQLYADFDGCVNIALAYQFVYAIIFIFL